ncbi:MAG: PepSY-associated TM helix domain-containing protein [Rhodospirillaceae bacterium]
MADITSDSVAHKDSKTRITVRLVHRWAGLAAVAWLSVLGLTGWILDHHDWRWTHQWTVPDWVTSARIDRLVPGTVMRHIEISQTNDQHWIGASERGLWETTDGGATWQDIPFEGQSGHPQVFRFMPTGAGGLDLIYMATDDGIWTVSGSADANAVAKPFALEGEVVTALSAGSTATELVGALHHGTLFRVDVNTPRDVTMIEVDDVTVSGLPESVTLNRFILDLHVGKGFLEQPWSILINDYGGIAMTILGLTGFLFWWLPRKWRTEKPNGTLKTRQKILRWLFRSHGPVIGVLAIVPILYLSITGIMVDHIYTLIEYGKSVHLPRENLPPIYQYRSLEGEIRYVIAYPDEPNRLSVSTRFGVLDTNDGGKTWTGDTTLPATLGTDAGLVNLLREDDMVFVGIGTVGNAYRKIDEKEWTFVDMPADHLAITDVSRQGDMWYLKNSRMISKGTLDGGFEASGVAYPPITGTTFFLFLADIHTGNIVHSEFIWVNDLVALMAIILAITGPIAWWRRKWM